MAMKLVPLQEKLYQVQYQGIVVQEKEDMIYVNVGLGELIEIWKMDINALSDIKIGDRLFIIRSKTKKHPLIIVSESLYKFYKILGKL